MAVVNLPTDISEILVIQGLMCYKRLSALKKGENERWPWLFLSAGSIMIKEESATFARSSLLPMMLFLRRSRRLFISGILRTSSV